MATDNYKRPASLPSELEPVKMNKEKLNLRIIVHRLAGRGAALLQKQKGHYHLLMGCPAIMVGLTAKAAISHGSRTTDIAGQGREGFIWRGKDPEPSTGLEPSSSLTVVTRDGKGRAIWI